MRSDFNRQIFFSKLCKRKGLDAPILKKSFLWIHQFWRKVFSGYTHFEEKFSLDAPIVYGRLENSPPKSNNNNNKNYTFLSLICRLRRRLKGQVCTFGGRSRCDKYYMNRYCALLWGLFVYQLKQGGGTLKTPQGREWNNTAFFYFLISGNDNVEGKSLEI